MENQILTPWFLDELPARTGLYQVFGGASPGFFQQGNYCHFDAEVGQWGKVENDPALAEKNKDQLQEWWRMRGWYWRGVAQCETANLFAHKQMLLELREECAEVKRELEAERAQAREFRGKYKSANFKLAHIQSAVRRACEDLE